MTTLEIIGEKLGSIDGGKILDVATGAGNFVHFLKESLRNYNEIIGIDTHEGAIKHASEYFKNDNKIKFITTDAYKTEFEDDSFDIVSISNSLHHFSDPKAVLEEMFRVLKKGGHIILSEMHSDEVQTDEQKTHVLLHHWWGKVDSLAGAVHNETYKSKDLFKFVKKLPLAECDLYSFSHEHDNPKDEKLVAHLSQVVETYLNRAKDYNADEEIINEGLELRERVESIGYAPAAMVFIVGKK